MSTRTTNAHRRSFACMARGTLAIIILGGDMASSDSWSKLTVNDGYASSSGNPRAGLKSQSTVASATSAATGPQPTWAAAEQSEETLGHAVRQRSRWQITHRKVLSRFHSFDQLAASASSLRRRRTRVIRAEDSGEAEESVTRVAEPAATESAVRKSTAAASEETLVRRGYGNFKPACPEAGCISFAG